jgi:hypothetical protein
MALQLIGPVLCDITKLKYIHFCIDNNLKYSVRYCFVGDERSTQITCDKAKWLVYISELNSNPYPNLIHITTNETAEPGLCLVNILTFYHCNIRPNCIHIHFNEKEYYGYLVIYVDDPEATVAKIMNTINNQPKQE